jgi:pyruvate dehydrogenase E2 component (dihydrolipoamide acetyltransferase)
MKVEIKVPQQGLTVEYITFNTWNVAAGDKVSRGDSVATIESEKAVLDVEAPQSGTVTELIGKQGEEYRIGDVLAYMEV